MTLRSRLAWAFSAMLLVPLAMLLLAGIMVSWWVPEVLNNRPVWPSGAAGPRNGPPLGGMLVVITLFVLTNGTLTWLVSRSVMRPLRLLEAAARRLGEGDLDPGPLPSSPPE